MYKLFLSACVLCVSILSAQEVTDKATGATFPDTISINQGGKDFTLKATGVSTRKKFFVKVYSVASYVEDGAGLTQSDAFDKILEPGKMKQLTLKWVRAVDEAKIKEGYNETFNKIVANGNGSLKEFADKYVSFFGAVNNGDVHEIRWTPENVVVVLINGQEKGTIESEAFAKVLWQIWFGKASVVNRDQLISLLK